MSHIDGSSAVIRAKRDRETGSEWKSLTSRLGILKVRLRGVEMRKTYEEKFENAFAAGMAAHEIESEEMIEFAGRIAGPMIYWSKHRGIPAERAGKLAADICRPLFKMMRVTA
jgi:hypothetical protein